MASRSFGYKVKIAMGKKVPSNLTGGKWRNMKYDHIYLKNNIKNNFIDGSIPDKCNIKGNLFRNDKKIDYHKGIASLNSSQALCINFFKKFFKEEKWEKILIKSLKEVGVPLDGKEIKAAAFEYVIDSQEGTYFDFYMEMDNGTKVSMEIKYTESKFGTPRYTKNDPRKYDRKWNEIYMKMVDDCTYLNCDKDTFLRYYQINRNICYAKDGDIVLFITPKANDAYGICEGRNYIDSLNNPNILNLYWEDLVRVLMKYVKNEPELLSYYETFKKKYIDILQEI